MADLAPLPTDWQTALEYVAHGLRNIRHEHGADAIAALSGQERAGVYNERSAPTT